MLLELLLLELLLLELLLLESLLLELLLLELMLLELLLLDVLLLDVFLGLDDAVLVGAARSLSNCCSTAAQNCGKDFEEASLIVARNKVGIA